MDLYVDVGKLRAAMTQTEQKLVKFAMRSHQHASSEGKLFSPLQSGLAQKKPSARQISQFICQDIIPQGWKLFVEGQLIALRSFFQMF